MNAEADKQKKDRIEALNQADSTIYQTEKTLNEHGDKVSDDDPFSAYGEGIKYTESRKEFLPELRVDWLVEDGIIKP